jgi:hypothetical protein
MHRAAIPSLAKKSMYGSRTTQPFSSSAMNFGMTTSAGKPVDPMRKLFSQGTLATDPEKRIQSIVDPVTGKIVPKMMYHKRLIKNDDGSENVQITLDESDIGALEKIVQRHRKSAGLEPLPDDKIQALVADAQRNMRTLQQPKSCTPTRSTRSIISAPSAKLLMSSPVSGLATPILMIRSRRRFASLFLKVRIERSEEPFNLAATSRH